MTGAKSKPVDQARKESFAESMIDMLNKGALAVMVSIGHRTGLFDAMSRLSPSTSAEIAGEAGLNERYVREWLGAMVTGRVVEFDPEGRIYRLPAEHAASLTRAAAPDNIAAFTQYIPMMGTVEDQIVECFRKGGGVPYSSYRRFHEVMAEDSGQTVVPALIDHILPLVPGFPENLKKGIEVLDIGCGSGKALNLMAEAFLQILGESGHQGKNVIDEGRHHGLSAVLGHHFMKPPGIRNRGDQRESCGRT